MRIALLILFVCLALASGNSASAWAQNVTPPIAVRSGEHPDFDRIVFDWPRSITYKVTRDGNRVRLSFSAAGQPRFDSRANKLTRLRGLNTSIDGDGHLIVSFTVAAGAQIKDFISDKSVVIDVQGAAAPAVAPVATTAETKSTSPANVVNPENGKANEKPAENSQPEASKVLAASADKKANQAPTVITPPPTIAATPVPVVEQKAVPIAPPPAPAAAATTAPAPVAAPVKAFKTQPIEKPLATKGQTLPASDITNTPLLVATLDPHTATRAAIYLRAGYGYIVFDRKLMLSADALTAGQPAARVTLEPLDLPKASGFRFLVPPDVELRATRTGTAWQMYLAKLQPDVPVSTSLVAQPDFALGARFILPLPDAPEPVRLTDPVVGDDLVLVPLEQTQAFSVARRMADFQILPAAQGLVIRPLTEKIVVRVVSDGIEITAEGGLRLSSANDTGASQQSSQKAKAQASGKSLFEFSAWRGKPDETFTKTRQRLQQTIVDVPDAERNRARLELARFYFSRGYGEEAVALLNYLVKQVPDLIAHTDFRALMGASQILSYHPDDGLKTLDKPELNTQPEIELWQAVASAELRNWEEAEGKFSITENILVGYPEPFYSRFMVLAIESALAVDKDREASDWIDRLENGPHRDDIAPAIAYLRGVMHAKAGRAEAAQEAWKIAADSRDRLYKIRSELALIDLGVSTGSLTPAQAADRLEALRFGWRGDDLEVDILHRLGRFYVDAKNVKAGLNILSRAVQLYPTSPLTPQIQEEMSHIFHDVYLGDLGKNLSPLDALTLYQQYRDLMPSGKDGIAVTRNLAERLVAIDLLDQAAYLLEDLVKNKLTGEDKARTGARLAGIRLLDHKPDMALTALDYNKSETFAADIENDRQLLRAKALADLHREEEALALIQNNSKSAAKILRADITMHAQRWDEAAKTLLDLVGEPPKPGQQMRREQADWLVNAAIALSLAGDQVGVDKLAIDFGAAMAGTSQSDTFRILTQPDKTVQLKDIAQAQARIADVDLFQGFLNNYRKSGETPKTEANP